MTDYRQLLARTDAELARVDPLVINLLVAESIPSLADLDIDRYRLLADRWADEVRRRLPSAEIFFRETPHDWKNDVNFFRLGVLCGYLEQEAGLAYIEDQRYAKAIKYTDPSDLFLDGVMETRRGTCANMAALYVALGWRLGWPVSLACVRSHYICRYDDGAVTHNIEATQAGFGGFKSDSDEYLIKHYELPPKAISSGSGLRSVTPREMMGIFVGFRGRHMRDTDRLDEAERDYSLARHLFPSNRKLYIDATAVAVQRSVGLFEPCELGSPQSLVAWIDMQYRVTRSSMRTRPQPFPVKSIPYPASV